MNQYNYNQNTVSQNEEGLNVRELVEFCWRLKWWILASAAVALVVAFFWIRMQNPVYSAKSVILLNTDEASSQYSILNDVLGIGAGSKKIGNEVCILASPGLLSKVVEDLDLNFNYGHYVLPIGDGHIKVARTLFDFKHVGYYNDNPFSLSISENTLYPEEMRAESVSIAFRYRQDRGFVIKEFYVGGRPFAPEKKEWNWGEKIDCGPFVLSLSLGNPGDMIDGDVYTCSWNTPIVMARRIGKRLTVTSIGTQKTQNDIINITLDDTNKARARDIIDALVTKSNEEARAYANISTVNTIEFIDTRLAEIARELGDVENSYKNYQSARSAVSLDSQTQLTMTSDMEYRNQLTEVRLQQQVLDMITNYLAETPEGEYKVIPTNIGIADGSLNNIITTYNTLVSERNRMVSNSSESNPKVLSTNSQLEDGKKSIELSIANLVKVYSIREKELEKTISASQRKIADIPQQQFELQQMARKLEVIEPLYLLLQQKREEAQISMYSQNDNFRIIEGGYTSPVPVAPRSMMVYLVALILGACLPLAVVWIRMQLRTKIETKKDIEDNIDVSVLSVLPKGGHDSYTLIEKNSREPIAEAFRMMRSNIQYLPDAKVIQVTSSIPGEGKSFISSNLAISIAHTGKKVVLVGMDLRKPSLPKIFPDIKIDPMLSVVGYLIGKCSDIDAMINPSEAYPGLDIVFAGPVPPNPTELLSQGKEGEIIEALRQRYDYVIVDSAPYLPVSDSSLINAFVDATLYTVRANYSDLKLLPEIQQAASSTVRPIKNVHIILNDVDHSSNKYRYGYGAGYGYGYGSGHSSYGYGYGYGYGYNEADESLSGSESRKIRKQAL